MNFANVKEWNIPEGEVLRVIDSQNVVLWEKQTVDYTEPFYVENITNSTETLSIQKTDSSAPSISVYYSINKSTWSYLGKTSTTALTISLQPGDKLYLRASTNGWGESAWRTSVYVNSITGVSKVGGNIMSLMYGNSFNGTETTFKTNDYNQFRGLFYGNTNLINAYNLLLPVTSLTYGCYRNMFENCTSLTTVPKLPATTINEGCYDRMFCNCSSLTTAPSLPASVAFYMCYSEMFSGCTSLTTAPELPATRVLSSCYAGMFYNCTSLTTAPELPATSLETRCYRMMFKGSSVNYVKCLATSGISTDNTYEWLSETSSTGTFIKDANATWPTGVSGIPSGWTVVNV